MRFLGILAERPKNINKHYIVKRLASGNKLAGRLNGLDAQNKAEKRSVLFSLGVVGKATAKEAAELE